MTLSLLCREPLAIGEMKADTTVKSGSEPAQETSEARAANPPPESAKAEVVMATGDAMPPNAVAVVADLGLLTSGGDDVVMVESSTATPQPHAEAEGGAFPLPSLSVVETAKDKAMEVATTSLPGPRQAILESIPPYSGPMPVGLDASGHFPLAVLAEKRAKEQLADISLLRSSVEYALTDAAKEIAVPKRELDAAKGMTSLFCRLPPWRLGYFFSSLTRC